MLSNVIPVFIRIVDSDIGLEYSPLLPVYFFKMSFCRVSGGLDSLVLGEGQILAQVKQVYKVGQNCEGFGRQLNGLFKQVTLSFLLLLALILSYSHVCIFGKKLVLGHFFGQKLDRASVSLMI